MNAAQRLIDSVTPGLVTVDGKMISDPTKKPFWRKGLSFLNEVPVHDAIFVAEQLFCLAVKKELVAAGAVGREPDEDTPRLITAVVLKVISKAVQRGDILGFDPVTGKIKVAQGVEIGMPQVLSDGVGGYMAVPSTLAQRSAAEAEAADRAGLHQTTGEVSEDLVLDTSRFNFPSARGQ